MFVSVVEAELHLPDEQMEVALEAAVVDLQPPFGVAPEVLDAVDVAASIGEGLGVIDTLMVETFEGQLVVGRVAVGVDDGVQLDVDPDCADELLPVAASGRSTRTSPPRLSRPKTGILPAAPRPRLPLRTPPK